MKGFSVRGIKDDGAEDGAKIPFLDEDLVSEVVEELGVGGNCPGVGDVVAG